MTHLRIPTFRISDLSQVESDWASLQEKRWGEVVGDEDQEASPKYDFNIFIIIAIIAITMIVSQGGGRPSPFKSAVSPSWCWNWHLYLSQVCVSLYLYLSRCRYWYLYFSSYLYLWTRTGICLDILYVVFIADPALFNVVFLTLHFHHKFLHLLKMLFPCQG